MSFSIWSSLRPGLVARCCLCLAGSCLAAVSLVGCQAATEPPAAPGTVPVADSVAVPTDDAPSSKAALTANSGTASTEEPAFLPFPAEPDDDFVIEPDFQSLSLADFVSFPVDVDTWTELDNRLISTGKPKGYLYSRESFQNFTWRLEYRFPRPVGLEDDHAHPANTGFLVYITGATKVWPLCLEVQGKHSEMAEIRPNGGAESPEVQDDVSARLAARRPVGEWNRLEIVSRDGALRVTLNDLLVVQSEPNFLSAGSLGIQAEGFAFEVRRMRIRVDAADE